MNRTDIDELKRLNPIDQTIQTYGIGLRPVGSRLIGCCPLHNDRHPSLWVYPSTDSWFCWVCSVGGDVYTWIQAVEHVEFREARDRLAARTGCRTLPPRLTHAQPVGGMPSRCRLGPACG